MAKLTKTSTPGIYRRHVKDRGRGRCDCCYVVVWRHRGKQETETFRTYAEAKEGKGQREAGDKRPASRIRFGDYYNEWIETCAGRTSQGFQESSRRVYRLELSGAPMKRWKTWKLADVEPADVRSLFGQMRRDEISTVRIKRTRAALSALFATAVDGGLLRSSPVQGVRIPSPAVLEDDEPQVKALTKEQLGWVLFAVPDEWNLFFELLVHSGLRIGEAVGLTWEHVDLGEWPRLLVREQAIRASGRS